MGTVIGEKAPGSAAVRLRGVAQLRCRIMGVKGTVGPAPEAVSSGLFLSEARQLFDRELVKKAIVGVLRRGLDRAREQVLRLSSRSRFFFRSSSPRAYSRYASFSSGASSRARS